jgi:ATP-binding cassette, subfamily B, bacterial
MRPRFSPGEKPERPADPAVRRANLRRVFGLFKAYRWRLSVVLALIGFSALLSIVSPFLVRDIFDEALPENDNRLLTILVLGLIGIAVFTGILGVFQTWLSN